MKKMIFFSISFVFIVLSSYGKADIEIKNTTMSASTLRNLILETHGTTFSLKIKNATIKGKLDLSFLTIDCLLKIDSCIFLDSVNFKAVNFKENTEISGCTFKKNADYSFSIFYGHADLSQNKYYFEVDFSNSRFYEYAFFGNCNFLAKVKAQSILAERTFNLQLSKFRKGIQCTNSIFNNQLICSDIVVDSLADFSNIHVKNIASFRRSTFNKELWLNNSIFDNQIIFDRSSFKKDCNFNRLSALDAFFNNTVFNGNINFVSSHFGNTFNGIGLIDSTGNIDFSNSKMGTKFLLQESYIGRDLLLDYSNISGTATLDSSQIKNISIQESFIEGFESVNCQFLNSIFLNNTQFQYLKFSNNSYPASADSFSITDIKFDRLMVGENDKNINVDSFNNFLSKTAFNIGSYKRVEEFLSSEGRPEDGNDIYVEGKKRDKKLTNTILRWIIGNGRYPERALIWAMIVVTFGSFIFLRKNVCFTEEKNAGQKFNSFWYSLDLFVPGIDLGCKKFWRPTETWVIAYSILHTTLGWILIPLGLAALTGLVN